MRRTRRRQDEPLERPPVASKTRRRLSWHLMGVMILAALLLVAFAAPALGAPATAPFPDVPTTHPYAQAISDLRAVDIIGGDTNGLFNPNAPVKRAQFAKMVLGTLGVTVDKTATATAFTDLGSVLVASTGYPHSFINEAYKRGITQGTNTSPLRFAPWVEIQRDQVVTMTIRGIDNMYPGLLTAPPAGTPSLFTTVPEPHGSNLRKAEYYGLLDGLSGLGAGWDPYAKATRGEVAQMLWNFLMMPKEGGVREVSVRADGSGDYATLEAAVAAVPRGTRINLGEGVFTLAKTLQVDRSLSLVGRGSTKTTVTCASNTVRVSAALQGIFSAQDIAFRTTSPQKDADVMTVEGGDVRLLRCSFTGGGVEGNGLSACGETMYLLTSAAGDDAADGGIYPADGPLVFSGSRVIMNSCTFENNKGEGVFLWERAYAEINDCLIKDNGGWGVYCQDEVEVFIKNTSFTSNKAGGVIACGVSDVDLEQVTCSNNGQNLSAYGCGIVFTEGAGGLVESCTSNNNRMDGIMCEENATLLILDTRCIGNGRDGIAILDDGDSAIEDCRCGENGSDGIYLADHANSYMANNYCYRNGDWGIYCDGWSSGTMKGNTFSNNSAGAFFIGSQSTVSGQKPPGGG